jgi:hypothetical protein
MLLCAADACGLQPKMVFFNTATVPGKQLLLCVLYMCKDVGKRTHIRIKSHTVYTCIFQLRVKT